MYLSQNPFLYYCQLAGGRGILWRPPVQLVLYISYYPIQIRSCDAHSPWASISGDAPPPPKIWSGVDTSINVPERFYLLCAFLNMILCMMQQLPFSRVWHSR